MTDANETVQVYIEFTEVLTCSGHVSMAREQFQAHAAQLDTLKGAELEAYERTIANLLDRTVAEDEYSIVVEGFCIDVEDDTHAGG